MTTDPSSKTDAFVEPGDRQSQRICFCRAVHEASLRRAIRAGHRSIKALGEVTAAGTRCQSCHPDLQQLIDEEGGTEPQ